MVEQKGNETDWVLLFIAKNTAVYFDSFGIEHIPQDVLEIIKNKSITHNIFRIQSYNHIMCQFYCIALIEFMHARKTLLDYNNVIPPNDYNKNGKIISGMYLGKRLGTQNEKHPNSCI